MVDESWDALTVDEQRGLFAALWGKYDYHVMVIDREHRIVRLNRLFGGPPPEAIGRKLEAFVPAAQQAAIGSTVEAAFTSNQARWYDVGALITGETRHFRVVVIPTELGGRPVALLLSHEETERMRAQAELATAQAQYRTLTEHLPDFAVYIDRQRRYLWVNRLAPGLRLEDVLGRTIDDFVHPDELEDMRSAIESCFETHQIISCVGSTEVLGSGRRYLANRIIPVPPEDGVERVMILTADVTEQREAEIALRASEERLDLALRATATSLWEWWPIQQQVRLDMRWPEPGAEATLQVSSAEDWLSTIESKDRIQLRALLDAVRAGLRPSFDVEYSVRGPRDRTRWISHRAQVVERDGDTPLRVVGTLVDITQRHQADEERRRLEAQLQRAQRLESLGQLAGGVAHDFNNLLLVILGHAELIDDQLRAKNLDSSVLSPIFAAAQRATELTRQLLAFGRRQQIEPVSVNLVELAETQVRMLRRVIPETVQVIFEAARQAIWAAVDPGQFEQVVLNLCVNARDAMPDGGTLRLGIVERDVTEVDLTPEDVATPGPFVGLVVEDDGAGMTEAETARAFEPFYTTKPVGEGTGLGLAVIDGIVKQHGGFVRCTSVKNQGTTFAVYWRAAVEPSVRTAQPPIEELACGRGRVLLAEDEPRLRDVTSRVLMSAGYDVTVVANGTEALEVIARDSAGFDLLVLDAVMPGAGGYEVLQGARRNYPELPVLFTTGYAGTALPRGVESEAHVAILSKPYRRAALLRVVSELLSRRS
ncbi:MAG TPA: PAS domain-containing protein [Polyangiaceae bacterium]